MDKEQIIINGVDVSGCILLDEWKHCDSCNTLIKTIYPNATKCHVEQDLRCETYPNCYYKQLDRKTAECEELKKKNVILQNRNQQLDGATTEASRYRNALDEIKGMLDNGTANININAAHLVHQHYLARFCDIRNIISNAKAITT